MSRPALHGPDVLATLFSTSHAPQVQTLSCKCPVAPRGHHLLVSSLWQEGFRVLDPEKPLWRATWKGGLASRHWPGDLAAMAARTDEAWVLAWGLSLAYCGAPGPHRYREAG